MATPADILKWTAIIKEAKAAGLLKFCHQGVAVLALPEGTEPAASNPPPVATSPPGPPAEPPKTGNLL